MELNEILNRTRRAAARGDIEKLINSYAQYFPMCKTEAILALFAKRADSRVETLWGVYSGYESIERLYRYALPMETDEIRRTNELHIFPTYSQVIEIAGDGQTARAVWYAGGAESRKTLPQSDADLMKWENVSGCWSWKTMAADFIVEDGVWKIWHLHAYNIFMASFYKSFADEGELLQAEEVFKSYYCVDGKGAPDLPPTTEWHYDRDAVFSDGQPELPEPYESFAEIGHGY